MSIVATVASALVLGAACTASGIAGTASPFAETASPPPATSTAGASSGQLSESEATAAARPYLEDRSAPVWATMSGTFKDVYASFARASGLEGPIPDNVAADRLVWGIEFKVVVEISGPSGAQPEKRDGLHTIIVDGSTGEWLSAMTFAPSPGDPLPKP